MSTRFSAAILALSLATAACDDDSPTGNAGGNALPAIQAASAAWDQAYNSGSIATLMDLYASDAVSMPPGFPPLVGKSAIREDFEGFFADFTATHQTTIVQVEIDGDLAVERGDYLLSATPRGGGEGFSETGKHIVVRKNVGGTWLVLWEIWNSH